MRYVFNETLWQWEEVDNKGNVVMVVPTGTVVDTEKGRCSLRADGTMKFVKRRPPSTKNIIRNLWPFENARHEGLDKQTGLYYPFVTRAGNRDVGCGIDLKEHSEYLEETRKGITKERAEEIAASYLEPLSLTGSISESLSFQCFLSTRGTLA